MLISIYRKYLHYFERPCSQGMAKKTWRHERIILCICDQQVSFGQIMFSPPNKSFSRTPMSVPLSHAHSYSEWNVSPKGKFLPFMQMFQVYRLDRVFFHELHYPSCCLGNFADYGRKFHEGDRDTRSQSQNEEGPFLLSLQGSFVRFRRNLPHWRISEGLIRWCLFMIMKFTYSFFCW